MAVVCEGRDQNVRSQRPFTRHQNVERCWHHSLDVCVSFGDAECVQPNHRGFSGQNGDFRHTTRNYKSVSGSFHSKCGTSFTKHHQKWHSRETSVKTNMLINIHLHILVKKSVKINKLPKNEYCAHLKNTHISMVLTRIQWRANNDKKWFI